MKSRQRDKIVKYGIMLRTEIHNFYLKHERAYSVLLSLARYYPSNDLLYIISKALQE